MESWVKVPISEISDYYEVSNLGNVRHTRLKRLLKGKIDKYGYHTVSFHIRKLNYKMTHLVHRLVALAFLEPKKGCEQVDHIDRDKTNNSVDNLRWCDSQMNNCNRADQSKFGAHLSEMTLKGSHHYWRLNFQGKGVKLLKNFNKKDIPLESMQKLRDILAEDLGFTHLPPHPHPPTPLLPS
jgi:uncharacterized protein YxeA